MKWGEVRANDVFMTRHSEFWDSLLGEYDDVWVVLGTSPDEDRETFVKIRYVYLHDIGNALSESEFSVSTEDPVDYDAMFDAR